MQQYASNIFMYKISPPKIMLSAQNRMILSNEVPEYANLLYGVRSQSSE